MRTTSLFRTSLPAMLLLIIGICLAPCTVSAAPQKGNEAAAEGLPSTYADFKARCRTAAVTPEGAVKMYFDAVFCYLDPNRRAEASKMLRYIMHADSNWEGSQRHVTFLRRLKNPSYHYIFKSFAAGTSPENGYSMSPDNYKLLFTRKDRQQDYTRVFLRSSGADSDRRVWVKQYSDGFWYVINNADTYAKVRDPAVSDMNTSHDADFDITSPVAQPESEEAVTHPAAQPEPVENAVPPAVQPQFSENVASPTEQPKSVEEVTPPAAKPAESDESEMSTW